MIGLVGYTLFCDEITRQTDGSDALFISTLAISSLVDVFSKLDPELLKIDFGGNNIGKILESIEDRSTCIHGIGMQLLRFYVTAYDCITYFEPETTYVKAFRDAEEFSKVTKLAPYLYKLPDELMRETKDA